jgi:hypothetical protein
VRARYRDLLVVSARRYYQMICEWAGHTEAPVIKRTERSSKRSIAAVYDSASFRPGMTRPLDARNERSAGHPRHPSGFQAAHADERREILTRSGYALPSSPQQRRILILIVAGFPS